MIKKLLHWFSWILFVAVFFVAIITIRSNAIIIITSRDYIVESTEALWNWRPAQTVIIPWAMVYSSGKLSHVTEDRAVKAIEILKGGFAEKILVSGDNRTYYYNEVTAIRNYLVNQDIDPAIVFQDFAWFDTYDTMYRARYVFLVDNALITTQRYHLYRAVYIARNLGIDAIGVVSDSHSYQGMHSFQVREIFARVKAWGEVVFGSSPTFLWETVSIEGESNGRVGVERN